MAVDIETMKSIVKKLYIHSIFEAYGDQGVAALKTLIQDITSIYQRVEPSVATHPIIIFKAIGNATTTPIFSTKTISKREALIFEMNEPVIIEPLERGQFRIYPAASIDLTNLSSSAIVYLYANGIEKFLIRGAEEIIPNPSQIHASVFSRPTFSTLREALEDYRIRVARTSSCKILEEIWNNPKRIFLRIKPESSMRDSLEQFLRFGLRDASVRPEQTVDESHPVDIKVMWDFTDREALIEIKWLGDSADINGKITTKYRSSRANEGAKQLADYLDANRKRASDRVARGYLVVVDARRKGLVDGITAINRENGMLYANSEILYDPSFHTQRDDFEEPIRMFAEPICDLS